MKKILSLGLIGMVLFSCSARKSTEINSYDLDEVNKLLKIDAKVGETIKLGAKTNPSTGYSWSVYTDGDCNVNLVKKWTENIYEEGIVGAPLQEFFEVKANKSGTCVMKFNYSRGWSKSTGEEKSVKFTVK